MVDALKESTGMPMKNIVQQRRVLLCFWCCCHSSYCCVVAAAAAVVVVDSLKESTDSLKESTSMPMNSIEHINSRYSSGVTAVTVLQILETRTICASNYSQEPVLLKLQK